MKNKTMCIALSMFLALSMTACAAGQSTAESKAPQPESPSPQTSVESSPTTESRTESVGELVPRITGEEYRDTYKDSTDGLYYTADDFSMTKGLAAEAAAPGHDARSDAIMNTAPAAMPGSALTTDEGGTFSLPDEPVSFVEEPSEGLIEISEPYLPDQPEPKAGLLTAGEWNDNKNWGFFTNLVNSGTIQFPSFGIDPRYRYETQVKTPDGAAVMNAKVTLYDSNNQPLWTSVTDKEGIAYLFASQKEEGVWFTVESDGQKQEGSFVFDAVSEVSEVSEKSDEQQQDKLMTHVASANVTLDVENKPCQKTDIMFILDATGSMSDEMLFLQTEFTAISEAVGDEHTRYSVNFYRDKGDDYITKCYDFTTDIQGLQQKLNSESADGGGDTPEAVAEILEETIGKSNWDEDSVKLAFLIFDAPPHEDKQQSLLNSVKQAAEKGIRLIPIVSSGSERDTELFGRAAAIVTNGTYVFLTDDSGVGYSHMEPIIGSYQVEKLYDLVVRVINHYKQ